MAAALRLAKAGHAVTVVEQGERIGGKLNVWAPHVTGAGDFRFDTGPHVLTMPWAIRELFDDLGERMEDHLELVRMDPICRYHFADAPPFDAPADPADAARAIAARFPGDEAGFRDFLAYARRVHDVTIGPFLRQDFSDAIRGIPSPAQWAQLAAFLALKPWETVAQRVRRHLLHPRLRQIFDLYAFYNGSAPERASAIFSIIAWVQWGDGTFYLRGGLRTYADALHRLAEKFGVAVRLSAPGEGIEIAGEPGRGRVVGVRAGGELLPADAVVCNADPLTAYGSLIPPAHRPKGFTAPDIAEREPSTSAFLLLLGVRGAYDHLAHYNSFLPHDGFAEFDAIFERGVPADDPVIGVTCQSVTDPNCAPPGYSNLFVMTSPPALGPSFAWTPENTARYRDRVLDLLETRCGLTGLRDRIVCEQVWTPETFEARYGAWRGSLYGVSSNGWRSAFLRPSIRARGVQGLYFVGGGTHPGGGLPLVTLSGKIVADALARDKKNPGPSS
jgi:phytoene desaturase